jgi:hypothetical protein
MSTTKIKVRRIIEEEVTVDYSYYAPVRGSRSSLGVPEEPDEDECMEINSITTEDGTEIFSENIEGGVESVEEKIWDEVHK